MEPARVYFTNLKTGRSQSLLTKLDKLVRQAGITDLSFKDRFTAIKIHLGEPGNLAYLRPNYSKVIVDLIKAEGGKVFLTDCNTLYVGRRKNAVDHLEAAYENGYNPFVTGAQVIIADGLKGTDETLVSIKGTYVQTAKIGRAIMDADILVSMSHFKGHESTGFGGAIKNIGMGCGSHGGKMEMHCNGKPSVLKKHCVSCGACARDCAHGAISYDPQGIAHIHHDRCVGCGRCIGACQFGAIVVPWDEAKDILNRKMAEYAYAVLKDRPHFHISFVVDVSPYCDCLPANDMPIIPDVGIFASFDPVALDRACVDAANAQPVMAGSRLDHLKKEQAFEETDHFHINHPQSNWESCLDHCEAIGLGTQRYTLIEV